MQSSEAHCSVVDDVFVKLREDQGIRVIELRIELYCIGMYLICRVLHPE